MHFEQLTENMEALIAISDVTSNATYFNKAWETFTGRSRQELFEFGWADLIHEDDRKGFVTTYMDAFSSRSNWKGEFRMLSHDGNYRWLLATGTALQNDGEFAGYVSSSMDITDQVKARRRVEYNEQMLRDLVLTAPVGICVLNAPTLVAEIVNSSFVEIAGKPYETIINNYYWNSFGEVAYFADALKGVVDNGEPFFANEVPLTLIRHGKPDNIYVTFVYTPIKNVVGEVDKVIIWVLENTPQVIARQQVEALVSERTKDLGEANHKLQKSNSELEQFAFIASHDLQEPLRKIRVYSQMLEQTLSGDVTNPLSVDFLTKITTSATRMQSLIRDVLAYSQLSSETETFAEVDLQKTAQEAILDYELLIEQYNATVYCKDLPVIEANPVQLSQLFSNMINNALKFSRKDTVPVLHITGSKSTAAELAHHGLPADRVWYTIRFADNGIGITPENTKKLFNIFQRLHRQSEYQGTGIGLAMCKKVVLNHHGAIDATESNEKGAVFTVLLPEKQNKTALL